MKIFPLLFVVVGCIVASAMGDPANIIKENVHNTGVFQQGCEVDIAGHASRRCDHSKPGNYRSKDVQNTGVFIQG